MVGSLTKGDLGGALGEQRRRFVLLELSSLLLKALKGVRPVTAPLKGFEVPFWVDIRQALNCCDHFGI